MDEVELKLYIPSNNVLIRNPGRNPEERANSKLEKYSFALAVISSKHFWKDRIETGLASRQNISFGEKHFCLVSITEDQHQEANSRSMKRSKYVLEGNL